MTKKTDATDMNFKALVKQHIEAQVMSEQGLEKMESLLLGVEVTQAKAPDGFASNEPESLQMQGAEPQQAREGQKYHKQSRFRSLLALTASVLLLVLGLHWSPEIDWQAKMRGEQASTMSDMSFKIAAEVAKNHIKMKPLELKTAELSQLRGYFTALDFTPVSSSLIADNKQMIGGRYCSIQGLTAAQIRFAGKQPLTLYQVQYDKALYGELPNIDSGEKPLQLVERGVEVSIWVEKGLLMATARSIE